MFTTKSHKGKESFLKFIKNFYLYLKIMIKTKYECFIISYIKLNVNYELYILLLM